MIGSFRWWGWMAFILVGLGALQTVQGQDGERPVYETGKGTPPAHREGNVAQTKAQMRRVYNIMKAHDWDYLSVPIHLLQAPDHHLGEEPNQRDPKTTTFVFPESEVHNEIALYTSLYFRRNLRSFGDSRPAECYPEGFFLVMYKNGDLEQVDGKDVRMISTGNPKEPSEITYAFPGMKSYSPDLPRMLEYTEPFYRGGSLDPQ